MAKKTNCIINGIPYYRRYTTINSKRKMVYGESEKDWQRKVDKLKEEASLGLISTNSTVGQALETWLFDVYKNNPNIRQSTFSIHEGAYRNRLKNNEISQYKLKDVKSIHIQKFINGESENGRSAHSIQLARRILNMFFRYAVSEGYLLKNPCTNAHAPKAPPANEIKVFTDAEIERIKIALDGDRDRFLFILALATGLRQGELLALKHSDIKDVVTVNKTQLMHRYPDREGNILYEIKDTAPKTDASYRDVPLPENIKKEYELHKKICQLKKLKLGQGRLSDDDYLFSTTSGLRWQTGQIQKKWKTILMKAEADYKSFHSLRHTYITKLVQSGVNIVTVMQLAGHSKIETTLRYTHVEMEHKEKAIDVINELIK